MNILADIPAWISSLAAVAAVLSGAGFIRFVKGLRTKIVMEATTASIDAMLTSGMADAITGRDPSSFHTLDLDYESGGKDNVPLLYDRFLRVLQNTSIQVITSDATGTVMVMVCHGHGRIECHKHAGTEELTVIRGTVTCLKTGDVYRAGDRRVTDAGEYHGAAMYNTTCVLVHIPPLPTAAERPVSFRIPPNHS